MKTLEDEMYDLLLNLSEEELVDYFKILDESEDYIKKLWKLSTSKSKKEKEI